MKNIHILPTEKPSRIYLIKSNNKLGITSNNPEFTENFGGGTQNQNIYITSNEEIKVGDWVIEFQKGDDIGEVHFINSEYVIASDIQKKIILTTDELYIHNDLIPKEYNPFPQYIQKIDDEFLEWFVKNPSCEEVGIERGKLQIDDDGQEYGFPDMSKYKIIISKEEPKPHSFCETPELKCTMNYCDENGCQNRKRELVEPQEEPNPFELPKALPDDVFFKSLEESKQDYSGVHLRHCYQGEYEDGCKYGEDDCPAKPLEPKQETLEEFAKRKYLSRLDNFEKVDFKDGVFEGAKWQAERMYSEEEVKDLILKFNNDKPGIYDASEWFEQYKKKPTRNKYDTTNSSK
jgi:hypothetical protein